jgi:alpha-galactosidase
VWALHSAWSGNSAHWLERTPRHPAVLAAAELLAPGEVQLATGDRYEAPWALAVFSDRGLDGIAEQLHAMLRATSDRARSPRPVSLNTWEAVYFNHSIEVLGPLADAAARVGVERFVVDDGWFRGRLDDSRGVGDWFVDDVKWPGGLRPLVDRVTRLGLQFGLWVEPEAVNSDSDLAREHPEWISTSRPGHRPPGWRHEQVLDLTNPDAFAYVLGRLDALLTEYPITYLKWDYNRDHFGGGRDGHPTVRAQTLALYRLFDEITARHPRVEIESCASGGARVDLGIARWADRFWASDTIDPVERVDIQRWTNLILPLERIGTHLGAATAHTTGRTTSLAFRLAVATFGHFGIEADLGKLPDTDLEEIRRYVDWYKAWRPLLHSGIAFNEDHPDPSLRVHGVVSHDRSAALVACEQVTATAFEIPRRLRLHALDDDVVYNVRVADIPGPPPFGFAPPAWLRAGQAQLSGRSVRITGLQLPILLPESALVLELHADHDHPTAEPR